MLRRVRKRSRRYPHLLGTLALVSYLANLLRVRLATALGRKRTQESFPEEGDTGRTQLQPPAKPTIGAANPFGIEVDFVFKWVDGSRAKHSEKKSHWQDRLKGQTLSPPNAAFKCPAIDTQQNSIRRERNHDELRYALRSVYAHASWFRHIFVVVEGPHMLPDWLDRKQNVRLSVIYHDDIFPEPQSDYLPTFNGHAVASVLHRIPNLSEFFIAMDDDFFFTADVSLEHFFDIQDGRITAMKSIQSGAAIPTTENYDNCPEAHHHDVSSMNSATILHNLGSAYKVALPSFHALEHAPYVSSKSVQSILLDEILKNDTSALRTHRFRSKADFHVQALVVNFLRGPLRLKTIPKSVGVAPSHLRHSFQGLKPMSEQDLFERLYKLATEHQFLCVNDEMPERIPEEDTHAWQVFLRLFWPNASPWEKQKASENDELWSAFISQAISNFTAPEMYMKQTPAWFHSEFCPSKNASCWDHCLPFRGEVSGQVCSNATKFDLIKLSRNGHRPCHTSILHMLLDDVWDSMTRSTSAALRPILTLGTLLGAVRNGTLIWWTHDIDLAYLQDEWNQDLEDELHRRLHKKGYILFFQGIWRVCLHSNHPLAQIIYSPSTGRKARRMYAGDIPYLDLYGLSERDGIIKHQTQGQTLQKQTVYPLKNVSLLGKTYESFHDPLSFFRGAGYGDFLSERQENHRK